MFLVVLLAIVLLGLLMACLIDWATHMHMVKGEHVPYGRASYSIFVEEFEKVNWIKSDWSEALYSKNGRDDKIHANIIKFNGKGMIINNPISYTLTKIYVARYTKNKFTQDKNVTKWR